jgi:hypothetical protein
MDSCDAPRRIGSLQHPTPVTPARRDRCPLDDSLATVVRPGGLRALNAGQRRGLYPRPRRTKNASGTRCRPRHRRSRQLEHLFQVVSWLRESEPD